jgi:hypothetical protein
MLARFLAQNLCGFKATRLMLASFSSRSNPPTIFVAAENELNPSCVGR